MADASMAMLWQSAAVVVLAIALPLFASFLLDGAVALAHHRGKHKLVEAIAWTLGAASLGMILWFTGAALAEGLPGLDGHEARLRDLAHFVLPYSIGVALLGAVFRIPRVAGR